MEGDFLFSGRLILKHTLLLTAASVLLRLMGMAFQVYLAARIGAGGVGMVQLVLSVVTFALTLGLAGARVAAMSLCASAHGAHDRAGVCRALDACLGYVLVTSLAAAAALFFLAPVLSVRVLHEPQAVQSLRLGAGLLPVSCVSLVLGGYFTATGQVVRLTVIDACERVVCLGLTVLLLQLCGRDAIGAGFALIGGDLLACSAATAVLYAFSRRGRPRDAREGASCAARVRKLAAPLALSDALRAALRVTEQFLIPWGLMRSGLGEQAAMAAYGTVMGMVFPALMFPAALLYALIDLLIPELAACRAQDRCARLASVTEQCLRAGLLFGSFTAGLLFTLAPELAQLLFKSADAGQLLRVFAPMALMLYMDALVDGMLKGLSEQAATARYNTLTSALDVVLLLVFLPKCGMKGYIFVFFAAHAVNFALSLRRLVLSGGCRPGPAPLLRTALCAAAGCAGALLLPVPEAAAAAVTLRAAVFLAVWTLSALVTGTLEACLPPSLRTAARVR